MSFRALAEEVAKAQGGTRQIASYFENHRRKHVKYLMALAVVHVFTVGALAGHVWGLW